MHFAVCLFLFWCINGCRLGTDGQDFFTTYDEVHESFDAMGLQENLLRGIYAYGMFISAWMYCTNADQLFNINNPDWEVWFVLLALNLMLIYNEKLCFWVSRIISLSIFCLHWCLTKSDNFI